MVEFMVRSVTDRDISAFSRAENMSGVNSKPSCNKSLSLSEFLSRLFSVMFTSVIKR